MPNLFSLRKRLTSFVPKRGTGNEESQPKADNLHEEFPQTEIFSKIIQVQGEERLKPLCSISLNVKGLLLEWRKDKEATLSLPFVSTF